MDKLQLSEFSEEEQITLAILQSMEVCTDHEIKSEKETFVTQCLICNETTEEFMYTFCCDKPICFDCRNNCVAAKEIEDFQCPFCRTLEDSIPIGKKQSKKSKLPKVKLPGVEYKTVIVREHVREQPSTYRKKIPTQIPHFDFLQDNKKKIKSEFPSEVPLKRKFPFKSDSSKKQKVVM